MSSTFINRHWHPRAMLVCHVLAIALLVSWLWQPTRELWDAFDLWLFKLLNDPVHAAGLWAKVKEQLPGNMPITLYDGTPENPTEAAMREALKIYRDEGCDGIIAIGGGTLA